MLIQRKAHLREMAGEMDQKAKALESFCDFVVMLAARRAEVLKVSKIGAI